MPMGSNGGHDLERKKAITCRHYIIFQSIEQISKVRPLLTAQLLIPLMFNVLFYDIAAAAISISIITNGHFIQS
ncbi:hypothetical protein AB990_07375 [Alkalihalobacillus pseudalcaliphilus]|nr:hypothetical protein AB990_07375 [Alkalihalobacillus pseudalcaliphilus]